MLSGNAWYIGFKQYLTVKHIFHHEAGFNFMFDVYNALHVAHAYNNNNYYYYYT